ncbi:recQ-mediated genome instability protein 1 [Stylosanthes scabra]|uniref:RecQ-mediated genome instability protein 1 n=1 Tax=Stylosanthes scabra TaxID=79078 RepID=A0ABU6W2M4_9FABA|nr:recQ-mediated genome instability protein 1 [Stylosanthes scabra]
MRLRVEPGSIAFSKILGPRPTLAPLRSAIDHHNVEQLQTPQPSITSTSQPTNSSNFPSLPFQISDDDDDAAVIDVLDHFSPQPPPPAQPRSSSCPVGDSPWRLRMGLKSEWVNACPGKLEGSMRGFARFDVTAKAKL